MQRQAMAWQKERIMRVWALCLLWLCIVLPGRAVAVYTDEPGSDEPTADDPDA